MNRPLVLALVFVCAACSQEDAPVEQIAEAAEEVVAPATAEPTPLAKGRYAPQDTCAEVEGAADFRRRLAAAVKARDVDAVVALAASDIELDFGGGGGTAELRKRLSEPSWGLWDELDELMRMGCAANEQGGITIPWFFDQDIGEADPAASMLVTGEDVPVFDKPDPAGKRLATVSWDLVEIGNLDPEQAYQRVELADGTAGFVATDRLRSVLDYRLFASERNGRWRMTMFVAGD